MGLETTASTPAAPFRLANGRSNLGCSAKTEGVWRL